MQDQQPSLVKKYGPFAEKRYSDLLKFAKASSMAH